MNNKRIKDTEIRNVPIVIYQMGKVGSSSIYNSLKQNGFQVYHIHTLDLSRTKRIIDELIKKGLPVYPNSHVFQSPKVKK